ncbi:MAG: ABC transporter ATP-binding protein [Aggregatilineales bacterium]
MAEANRTTPDRIVECVRVERAYGAGETAVRVLCGLDLEIEQGALVALYGPSGSGKTTLLNLVGALDTATAGTVRIMGRDIAHMTERERTRLRRQEIGFVFQSYALLPTYTASENIDLALWLPNLPRRDRQMRTDAALQAVGLSAWADHMPDELSGGQRQRVAIARAIALRPRLVLADEPTAGIDTRTTKRILALFKEIARTQGTTFVIVSHDPLVAEHVNRAYDLQDGLLIPHQTNPESDIKPDSSLPSTVEERLATL